jgi:hypothetical protein
MSKANERQVAGDHYKAGLQHWDLMAYNKVGYFEAQITKYITRWKKKSGVQDVEKSIHYHEKLTELINDSVISVPQPVLVLMNGGWVTVPRHPVLLDEFKAANDLGDIEYTIFYLLLTYTSVDELKRVGVLLQHLLQMAKERATAKAEAN